MRKVFLITQAFILIPVFAIYCQWTNIGGEIPYNFEEIEFASESVGYAILDTIGLHYFGKTTDVGVSWQKIDINVPINNQQVKSLSFVSESTGIVNVTGYNEDDEWTSAILKTIDGGTTWSDITPTQISTQEYPPSAYVEFISSDVGYTTNRRDLLKTIDGGENWETVLTSYAFSATSSLQQIEFLDEYYGLVSWSDGTFYNQGGAYYTEDGGETWSSYILAEEDPWPIPHNSIRDISYPNEDSMYLLSLGGTPGTAQQIYRTLNGGLEWDTLYPGVVSEDYYRAERMYFTSADVGYISTDEGFIYKTIDHGTSWTEVFNLPDENLGLGAIGDNGTSIFVSGLYTDSTLISDDVLSIYEPLPKRSLEVFPNPIGSEEIIKISTSFSGLVRAYDGMGKKIHEVTLYQSRTLDLSLTNLSKGIYIFRFEDEQGVVSKRIVLD